ncbi:MAG: hypothetical protein MUC36_15275, partial [Planctomycetes bacterium]|nr:hypothetical protein [Planctomycetota bacterium]
MSITPFFQTMVNGPTPGTVLISGSTTLVRSGGAVIPVQWTGSYVFSQPIVLPAPQVADLTMNWTQTGNTFQLSGTTDVSIESCDRPSRATLVGSGDDVVFATHYPLGFTFPMAGSAGAWTHCRVSTNGWIALTDGVNSIGIPGSTNYGTVAQLTGAAGDVPRIAPYWGDLNLTGANGSAVYIDNSTGPGNSFKVSWVNAVDFGNTIQKTFTAELFSNGDVRFAYSKRMNVNAGGTKIVGISCSNGAVAPPPSDLIPGPATTAGGIIYETFGIGAFDCGGASLTAVPSGGLGWVESATCQDPGATSLSYGTGCYDISDSIYERFADAASASARLTGQSLALTPVGSEWLASWGGGTYIPPSGAAVNAFASPTDDGEVVITPSVPWPAPTGPQATLRLHSNGIVSWGPSAQTFPGTSSFTPTRAGFLGAANAGVWSWHDYNEAEAGSGRIKYEEVGGVLCFTWPAVENFSQPPGANPSTMQIQLSPGGNIVVIWPAIDADSTSEFGSAHLVGWSPAGPSVDAGSINLSTGLPLVTTPVNMPAIRLSVSPLPISTAVSGTLLTYTLSNVPEAFPGSGVYVGVTILSLSQVLGGTDL